LLDTKVRLRLSGLDNADHIKVKEYKNWLNDRNIKHNFVKNPDWSVIPEYVLLEAGDAMAFKLAFGL